MMRNWTFGRRIGLGFALVVALTLAIGTIATVALHRVVESKDYVIDVNAQHLTDAERLRAEVERKVAQSRGYLLTGARELLDDTRAARREFQATLDALAATTPDADGRAQLDRIRSAEIAHDEAFERVLAQRPAGDASGVDLASISRQFDTDLRPRREALAQAIDAFVEGERRRLSAARDGASATASGATTLVFGIAAGAVIAAILIAIVLIRGLGRQIGTAIGHVQSSSAELQAAASEQAAGAKEQATAISEISTTIVELLATSRQIAESAQRVAQIAAQTAESARAGTGTVGQADESMGAIQRQVETVVGHMLELGRKSQQIGSVLDLVAELAEQTNILSINASIEAAGAGDAGKRFAVVAEEIRKLADRTAGSTKEIRVLIDDIRSAVNTTVMATESGSKAVQAGSRQFADVAAGFTRIAGLVGTTTEAAREIELSTKQQSTAVEQVNLAIASVAQASRESEASSAQTLQTASLLSGLSRDLLLMVRRTA